MGLVITTVTANKTYILNNISNGAPLFASEVNSTTLRLTNKYTRSSTDYASTEANFADFEFDGTNPSNIADAVKRVNDIVNFSTASGGSGARSTIVLTGSPFADFTALETAAAANLSLLHNSQTQVTIATVSDDAVYEYAGGDTPASYTAGSWVKRNRLDMPAQGGIQSLDNQTITADYVTNGVPLTGATTIVAVIIDGTFASNFSYSSNRVTSSEFVVGQIVTILYK